MLKKLGHLPTVWVLLIILLWYSSTWTSVQGHLYIGYCLERHDQTPGGFCWLDLITDRGVCFHEDARNSWLYLISVTSAALGAQDLYPLIH